MNPLRSRSTRLSRRALLQVGFSSAAGLTIDQVLGSRQAHASEGGARAKSVLFVFLTGGPSQLDTFDMKPEAPTEVRGSFRPIASRTGGLLICEHLPLLAERSDRYAVVRTFTCDRSLGAHDFATHALLAGIDRPPAGPTRAASRHDWPCYAAGLDYLRPSREGIPSGVHLPLYLADGGVGDYPGQNAGVLGGCHDPWQLTKDPNQADFRVSGLDVQHGLSLSRLGDRVQLLADLDQRRREADEFELARSYAGHQSRAVSLLTSGRLARAFDLEREPDRVRDRYGRHLYGQSLLLARRLVEAGVPIVQANLGLLTAHWDTHQDNEKHLRETLLPPTDRAVSALLDDLFMSGLLNETLVIVMGEFGRTPKLGGNVGTPTFSPSGRDHWTDCFFGLFAGAGVQGGRVIGRSDRLAAYPLDHPFTPADLGATLYQAIGISPSSEVRDRLGRPMTLNLGTPIDELYS